MIQKSLIILILIFTFSCSNNRNEKQKHNNHEVTPQVLENNKTDFGLSSYNKRMNNDIVQQLFEEAISKDEKLNSINSRIIKINEIKNDSLENYNTYINNNNNYWQSVRTHASRLTDTLLRKELQILIEGLEKRYQEKLQPINSTVTQIEDRQRTLRDQEILMKILVTEPMMNNYQRNEYPNINKLEAVKKSYDSLIKDVKPYTKINK